VSRQNGYSLAELLTSLAIISLILLVSIPSFGGIWRKYAVRVASASIRSVFQLARSRAIARGANCGAKFVRVSGEWRYALYDDGDGDGVRSDDIERGTDKRVTPLQVVFPHSKAVSIGVLAENILDPDGDPLLATSSPVQFNRSTICSFSPLGQATPGTIYLTAPDRNLWAVRVYGATGKLTVLRYDTGSRKWRR
jgi:prepilin-type N-terminal cleavage/methylation domain-containing protein